MIKNFYIGNFKAFGKTQKIPIKPITLIFGPNSSGKSSILQSLLFTQHIHKTEDFNVHKTQMGNVDLGGFPYFIHKHNGEKILTLGFDLLKNNPFKKIFSDFNTLNLEIQLGKYQENIEIIKIKIICDSHQLIEFTNCAYDSKRRNSYRLNCYMKCNFIDKDFLSNLIVNVFPIFPYFNNIKYSNIDIDELLEAAKQTYVIGNRGLIPYPHDYIPYSSSWSQEGNKINPSVENKEFGEYFHDLFSFFFIRFSRIFDMEINKILYLGPFRCSPNRHIFSSTAHKLDKFSTGETAWKVILEHDNIRNDLINKWMKQIFNNTYEFKVQKFIDCKNKNNIIKELFLRDKKWNVELSHHDVGFGISQVIPILVNAFAYKKTKILIEQPELHLHPALQAEIGDMFIESALGQNNNTFLLETHSEHLILRIMRRIRECYHDPEKYKKKTGLPPITPNDVAVLYVERQGDQSVVKEIPITPDGEFAVPWPDGFFTERAKELF